MTHREELELEIAHAEITAARLARELDSEFSNRKYVRLQKLVQHHQHLVDLLDK